MKKPSACSKNTAVLGLVFGLIVIASSLLLLYTIITTLTIAAEINFSDTRMGPWPVWALLSFIFIARALKAIVYYIKVLFGIASLNCPNIEE